VNREIPAGTAFETLEKNTKTAWTDSVLSRVTTTDTSNTTKLQLLYSSLCHFLIIPTNKTGENPLWSSSEPYYDDIFTFWDLVSLPFVSQDVFRSISHSIAFLLVPLRHAPLARPAADSI
jgi:hypothetical protein